MKARYILPVKMFDCSNFNAISWKAYTAIMTDRAMTLPVTMQ